MLSKNDIIPLSSKSVMIGEKSNIIPGPPRGDLSISLRIGDSIGSVNAKTNATTLPVLAIGIHERTARAIIIIDRMLNNQRTASIMMGIIAIYLRPWVFGMM